MATHRRTAALAAALVAVVPIVAACGNSGGSSSNTAASSGKGSVVLMLPGTRGDGGFFDESIAGVEQGATKAGWTSKVVEAGYETTKWQPALTDIANGKANLVIAGSFAMKEIVEQTAAQHPEKNFVLYDVQADLKACGCKNIYSIVYRYKETGFLAGALAALLEQAGSGVPRINKAKVVGVVGGQDIPVIKDYINGFKLGVAHIDPSIKVLSAFAGSFDDPVKGKAIGTDMTSQGADVLFTAAGATDKGVIEAAANANVWALGNSRIQATNPKVNGKDAVLTSSETSVSSSLADAVELAAANKLPAGQTRSFGAKEGTNKIVNSALYQSVVPAATRDKMASVQSQVAAGQFAAQLGG